MPTLEQRIRARAHQIWKDEGCPEGRAAAHWEQARLLIAIEDDRKSLKPLASQSSGEPVEEARIQENLGEFPAGRTDQGERPATPSDKQDRAGRSPMSDFWNWWGGDRRS
jgi:hypothetical protein